MKKLFVIITIVICLAIIILGHTHWKNMIKQNATIAEAQTGLMDDDDALRDKNEEKPKTEQKTTTNKNNIDIDALTKSLPEDIKGKITNAYGQNKQVTVILAGGDAISGLAPLLQEKLDAAYGKNLFKVDEKIYKGKNTLGVFTGGLYENMVAAKPDLVIFTPMFANDQGKVGTMDSGVAPIKIGDRFKEESPDTVFMIEPPNPISAYDASGRVGALKTAAEDKGYTYINHLGAWPTGKDLEADLDKSGRYPNDKGLKIWADYLAGYFTSEN